MSRDLVMLRYTDDDGERLAAVCRPSEGVETLRSIIHEEDDYNLRFSDHEERSAVILDTSGPVFVFDADHAMTLSVWFGLAAEWLRQREAMDELEDGDDNDDSESD